MSKVDYDASLKELLEKQTRMDAEWDEASTAKALMLGETCLTCTHMDSYGTPSCHAPGYIQSPREYVEYCRPRILATYFEAK